MIWESEIDALIRSPMSSLISLYISWPACSPFFDSISSSSSSIIPRHFASASAQFLLEASLFFFLEPPLVLPIFGLDDPPVLLFSRLQLPLILAIYNLDLFFLLICRTTSSSGILLRRLITFCEWKSSFSSLILGSLLILQSIWSTLYLSGQRVGACW